MWRFKNMTPIERQNLFNQIIIMKCLRKDADKDNIKSLDRNIRRTVNILEQKESEEPCCEMPEDMLELKTGRKMGMSSMGINIGKFANARRGGKE